MITLEEVTSIEEFIITIKKIRRTWFRNVNYPTIWYRGINNSDYKLLPGAYWRNKCDEESMANSFMSTALPYIQHQPKDDWDWYFIMQHYGIPTRLLDWTESPLIGLYFSLINTKKGLRPTVWMVDPVCINQSAYGKKEDYLYIIGGRSINSYLPDSCGKNRKPITSNDPEEFPSNEMPIAICPNRNNPRIVAQKGVFTLHGTKPIPLEEVIVNNPFGIPHRIAKIDIIHKQPRLLLKELCNLGIDTPSLFPETEKIAEYTKQIYDIIN
jgi:hypothetical protein